ncbi:hypothetical protein [Flavobacterium sp.]|uniref:hypothetical protein n=1 Tax=Flavobacterium sp. TaxID=239 RepID=UPI00261C67C7|nr:hypothetical protein [Flavobacterium sp.]
MNSDGFHIDVKGFPELKRKIQQLDKDPAKKTEILGILRSVASATVSKAKELAPVSEKDHLVSGKRTRKMIRPGNLKRSIGTITGKRGAAVINPTIYVGPRAKGNYDGWYGAMVEAGHNVYRNAKKYEVYKRKKTKRNRNSLERIRGKGVNNKVGFVPGWFYLKKAYAATNGNVTAESASKVAKYIQRRIDRL